MKLRLAVAATLLATLAVAPATGHAAPVPEPAVGVADVVVDAARSRVYYSSGASANQVVSVGFDGRSRTVLDNQFGASGMVLGADGRTLYVALAAGDAISAIDTATFTERTRYPTGAHSCPTHLVRGGTDVWFGYGCDAWSGAIGRLATAVQPPPVTHHHQTEDPAGDKKTFERAPLLAAGGPTGGVVVASQPHISPVGVRLYAAGERGLTETGRGDRGGSNLSALAVRPDGKVFYTAAGSEDHVDGFLAEPTMGGAGAWPTGQAPNALAASPDGKWLVTGVRTAGPDKASVFLYAPDASQTPKGFALPRGERLVQRGIAWAADGSVFVVVTQQGQDPTPVLHVVDPDRIRPGPGPWPLV